MKDKESGLKQSNYELNKQAKKAIQDAFTELLLENDIEDISITEIVNKAGVSRSTYYRNYTDKMDIINEMSYNFVKFLLVSLRNKEYSFDHYRWYLHILSYVEENKRMTEILLKIKDSYIADLFPALKSGKYTEEEQYQIVAFEFAFASIVAKWVKSNFNLPKENLAKLCMDTLPSVNLLFRNWEKRN